ncbi:hypothetical protein [Segeticoccus rhizosphaerae]|uniref:hypothetical protein n=1 Tax=Segeticoccus rhizosphaerae TaxID=1104777 RepID=UPI0012643A22|nr:hypothetical protein [Segeticoccus rhizosphaerae]
MVAALRVGYPLGRRHELVEGASHVLLPFRRLDGCCLGITRGAHGDDDAGQAHQHRDDGDQIAPAEGAHAQTVAPATVIRS